MNDVRKAAACVGRALLATCFLPTWLLASTGCDGGGRSGVLSFEVAELVSMSDDQCVADTTGTLGEGIPCVVLRLYQRDEDGSLTPVPLFRPGDDHAESAPGSLELRFDTPQIAFDARLEQGQAHDVVIAVFTGSHWAPAYGAHLENVTVGPDPLRVRLEPYGQWACAGRATDGALVPRALHEAVRVGNGDVLLLGGITGDVIDPASAQGGDRAGGLLQPQVEVYDADQQRVRRVTTVGMEGFGRVLFSAVYLGSEGADRHRIRAIGGFQLPPDRAGAAVLTFDNTMSAFAPLGAPFAPSTDAEVAPTIDLVYDSAQLTLEVVAMPPQAAIGAATEVSEPLDDGTRALLIGLARTGAGWGPAGSWYTLDATDGIPLAHPRLGASINAIPSQSQFLIWGGNLSTDMPLVLETAGELVQPGGAAVAISALDGTLPPPVAFHTTTEVDEGRFVVVGGLAVELTGNLGQSQPADPIFALRANAGVVTKEDVADLGYASSILHTATNVPGVGVVITGGAVLDAGNRLAPVATVGRVHDIGGALAYDDGLPDLSVARWGHAATLLPGNRLLITGGLARNASLPTRLSTLASAQVLMLDAPLYDQIADGACVDQATTPEPDAGTDAGALDASVMDGGVVPADGAVPLPDGG